MAVPSFHKQWDVDPNNVGGRYVANLEDHQRTLFAIKEALTGGGSGELSNPMTVVSSSDGATADASDNWTAYTDLVWGAGNHSWIVLQMGGSSLQVCFDLNNANARLMAAYWSPGGNFTGGSISARPTASDEMDFITTGSSIFGWLGQNTGLGSYVVHVWGSTDGKAYRVAVYYQAGTCANFMLFEQLTNPVTPAGAPAWDGHLVQFIYPTSAGGDCLRSNGGNAPDDQARTLISYDGTLYPVELVSPGFGTMDATETLRTYKPEAEVAAPNQLTEEWEVQPLGAFINDTSTPFRGWIGQLADIWYGTTADSPPHLAGRNDGDTYGEEGEADELEMVELGNLVLPWGLALDLRLGFWEDP